MVKSIPWISLAARIGLGVMRLYYSVPKLSYSSDALQLAVRQYQIGPTGVANAFGTVQPFLELALGLLVILGLGTRLTAALSALLLVYIGGIISLGARGIAIVNSASRGICAIQISGRIQP